MAISLKGINQEKLFLEKYLIKREPQIIALIPNIDSLDWECSKLAQNSYEVVLKVRSGNKFLEAKGKGINLYSCVRTAIGHIEKKSKKIFLIEEVESWAKKVYSNHHSKVA